MIIVSVRHALSNKGAQLLKRTLVQKEFDSLACRQFAFRVLLLDTLGAATQTRFFTPLAQLQGFGIDGHYLFSNALLAITIL